LAIFICKQNIIIELYLYKILVFVLKNDKYFNLKKLHLLKRCVHQRFSRCKKNDEKKIYNIELKIFFF